MTQPQTATVEYQELIGRADELETLLPPPPGCDGDSGPDGPPSKFVQSIDATQQLSLSADNLRRYLNAGQREWNVLAQSLRDAAKVYETTDENSGEAISASNNDGAATTSEAAGQERATSAPAETVTPTSYADTYAASKTSNTSGNYYPVADAASDVDDYDAGALVGQFATEWTKYATSLEQATFAFRPFQYWDGDAASAIESAFDQQRSWLAQLAPLCTDLAARANSLASGTRTLYADHPTYAEVKKVENAMAIWYANRKKVAGASQQYKNWQKKYAKLQKQSEDALAQYPGNAGLPVPLSQPPMPPSAYRYSAPGTGSNGSAIDPSTYDAPDSGSPGVNAGTPSDNPLGTTVPPSGGLPSTGGFPSTPTDTTLTGAPGLPTGSGVKPASFGGGGAGGLGAPGMPLQPPAVYPASPTPAAAPRTPGPAGIIPGGALGGRGGMGMAPMAPGAGQGQGQNGRGKRLSQDDQALYTENRAWTSAIIGNRRRNDTPDSN